MSSYSSKNPNSIDEDERTQFVTIKTKSLPALFPMKDNRRHKQSTPSRKKRIKQSDERKEGAKRSKPSTGSRSRVHTPIEKDFPVSDGTNSSRSKIGGSLRNKTPSQKRGYAEIEQTSCMTLREVERQEVHKRSKPSPETRSKANTPADKNDDLPITDRTNSSRVCRDNSPRNRASQKRKIEQPSCMTLIREVERQENAKRSKRSTGANTPIDKNEDLPMSDRANSSRVVGKDSSLRNRTPTHEKRCHDKVEPSCMTLIREAERTEMHKIQPIKEALKEISHKELKAEPKPAEILKPLPEIPKKFSKESPAEKPKTQPKSLSEVPKKCSKESPAEKPKVQPKPLSDAPKKVSSEVPNVQPKPLSDAPKKVSSEKPNVQPKPLSDAPKKISAEKPEVQPKPLSEAPKKVSSGTSKVQPKPLSDAPKNVSKEASTGTPKVKLLMESTQEGSREHSLKEVTQEGSRENSLKEVTCEECKAAEKCKKS